MRARSAVILALVICGCAGAGSPVLADPCIANPLRPPVPDAPSELRIISVTPIAAQDDGDGPGAPDQGPGRLGLSIETRVSIRGLFGGVPAIGAAVVASPRADGVQIVPSTALVDSTGMVNITVWNRRVQPLDTLIVDIAAMFANQESAHSPVAICRANLRVGGAVLPTGV